MLVSEAVDDDGRRKLVTKSDEAFGLLLIDNYIDKWAATLTNAADVETNTDKAANSETTPENDADAETTLAKDVDTGVENTTTKEKKGTERLMGKYTAEKSGHCKYGGWSRDGTKRFNEFHRLVQEDRAC